jgi:hypothetical protein
LIFLLLNHSARSVICDEPMDRISMGEWKGLSWDRSMDRIAICDFYLYSKIGLSVHRSIVIHGFHHHP